MRKLLIILLGLLAIVSLLLLGDIIPKDSTSVRPELIKHSIVLFLLLFGLIISASGIYRSFKDCASKLWKIIWIISILIITTSILFNLFAVWFYYGVLDKGLIGF